MKKIIKLLASALAVGFIAMGTSAFACEKCKVQGAAPCDKQQLKIESYAHPTLFDQKQEIYVNGSGGNYIVGAKVYKAKNKAGVKNKENVYVNAFAKDILDAMREKQFGADPGKLFDSKKPILRSELAFILAEGLNINTVSKGKKYFDVPSSYWAASQIDKAYSAGVMIGYPGDNFRPDQAITKAEVFAVLAQMINVPIEKSSTVVYRGKEVQYIPTWAISASKEAIASKLLDKLPDQSRIIDSEYLSKEQVAYIFGELRNDFHFYKNLAIDKNAPDFLKNYKPVALNVKLLDRISARVSNLDDVFTAKTTQDVIVEGKSFPTGSIVKGRVIGVQRPGVKQSGWVKVKFVEIVNGKDKAQFPQHISEAQADTLKNPNIIARILGAPLSGSARVVGVVGRTAGTGVNVISNGVEEFGDELSNAFVETFTLHPGSGAKSVGDMFITTGKGIYDVLKLVASGTFGILYEITDEIKYVILPSTSNNSSLNPNEELVILF